MKKRIRSIPLQFWVTPSEEKKILRNMKRNGMKNLSEYLRILSLSNAQITFSVNIPTVVEVSDAQLERSSIPVYGPKSGEAGKEIKHRATG